MAQGMPRHLRQLAETAPVVITGEFAGQSVGALQVVKRVLMCVDRQNAQLSNAAQSGAGVLGNSDPTELATLGRACQRTMTKW